jgi:hypothetical protein
MLITLFFHSVYSINAYSNCPIIFGTKYAYKPIKKVKPTFSQKNQAFFLYCALIILNYFDIINLNL